MSRVFNFSAGPAQLPIEVLQRAQKELLDWNNTGISVMEMSHRGKEFISIANKAENDLRDLMSIPNNYKVLFLQGGATAQFSAIPLNLTQAGDKVDYFNTGSWSKKAIGDAKRYCDVNIVCESTTEIPDIDNWNLSSGARYVHFTANETIEGVEFQDLPEIGDKILVSDMSSNFISKPIDVSKFGVIYAGSQKNAGPAGMAIVIVRDDLLEYAREVTPSILNWKLFSESNSMYNTPPTYTIYMTGLVFQWLKDLGGLKAMAEINKTKADKLYSYIDNSNFYSNPVKVQYRSNMNIPFVLPDKNLDSLFLTESTQQGLVTLKGHRSVGGMRASIYNSMPIEGIDKLISVMEKFKQHHS